jgi:sporulation protein YlmC with PRC-barrel domain
MKLNISTNTKQNTEDTKYMRRKITRIISTAATSVLAFSALAQDSPKLNSDQSDHARDHRSSARRADRLNDAAKASDILGMTVKNLQDEKLGKVEDLAVDVESGRIVQVIVSTGGFLGVGDTLTAVPPGALHHDTAQKVLHLDADKEKLKSGPPFEMSKWAEYSDADHVAAVYRHYGEEPALKFIHDGDANLDGQHHTDVSPIPLSTSKADGNWNKDRIPSETQSMIAKSRLVQVQKASKLIGTPVKNLRDEKLGKVENLLVDLPSGRVVAVIVSSGGFLGMGDELSAVPPSALRFTTDRNTLLLDASKDMLSHAPHFKADQWPDFAQPGYASGVYSAYRIDPYFTTNVTTEPDNTARNVRDRADRAVTPLDQGNSKADLGTTAQIRKEIIAGKTMSVNAKNVKIMTIDGRVTLRGPVTTDEEKRLIGDIAINIAKLENVDNQLEVKTVPIPN